ncbi:class I SAM-dependent methyltransferase, partial [Akkermansiaceae bacterium]|nr:class I SAM-dependent methyltransferase [Akkermansiaceae bacterium]
MMIRLKNDGIATVSLNDIQLEMRDQVESKVKNGTYQLEEISCPVCQKVDREIVGEKDRYGLTCTTNLCRSCGLAYTSPRMVQEAFNDFYNKEYRKLYGGTIAATGEFFAQQEETGKKIYHFLESNDLLAGQSLSVFEVGCGAGGILNFFKKKGHKVSGIDLGEEYLKYGRKEHGLDIRGGTLADIELIQKPD